MTLCTALQHQFRLTWQYSQKMIVAHSRVVSQLTADRRYLKALLARLCHVAALRNQSAHDCDRPARTERQNNQK